MAHSLNRPFDESELAGIVKLMTPVDRTAFVEFTKLYRPDGSRRRHLSSEPPTRRARKTFRQVAAIVGAYLLALTVCAWVSGAAFMGVIAIGALWVGRDLSRAVVQYRRESQWAAAELAQQYFVARLQEVSVMESLKAREAESGIISEFEFMMDCYRQRYTDLRKSTPAQFVKQHDERMARQYPEATHLFSTLARKRVSTPVSSRS